MTLAEELAGKYVERIGKRDIVVQVTPTLDRDETLYYPVPIKPDPIDADFCARQLRLCVQNAINEAIDRCATEADNEPAGDPHEGAYRTRIVQRIRALKG